MAEAFGGGYFRRGRDHGVDAYLRACAEMRTAPISKLVRNAGECTSVDIPHRGLGDR
eukprot:CAMPEP_0173451030 /NCGR_PEP_ID=MMETSP1357-20121228/45952_1 /TAXON_ID=77926 /ORGANISM="Hemiselmis rufescens, Strain PCC563" /LENGTH=56 /DNA_ID=CAMNT_0014417753 /DNA_START=45 /DNA_END=211 /DNA_ORIENTATION=-